MQEQAKEIFSLIRDTLRSKKARILQERVFLTQNVMEIVASVRSKEYGDIDDGVAPGFLAGVEGIFGPIAGVDTVNIERHAIAMTSGGTFYESFNFRSL